MNTRRVLCLGLTVSALGLTACAGPKAPFNVGTQAAPVDLVLGEHKAVIEAPVGPFSLDLPSDFTNYVPVGRAPAPVEDLGPCPDYDPIAPATSDGDLKGPPPEATYTYRAKTTD